MITLKLDPEQIELLQAAVEVMMENEGDEEVYGELADLQTLLTKTQEKYYA